MNDDLRSREEGGQDLIGAGFEEGKGLESQHGKSPNEDEVTKVTVDDEHDSRLLKELVDALDINSKEKVDEVRRLLDNSKDLRSGRHLPKKAREAKKAARASMAQEIDEEIEEEELIWEDKDILKGLGVSSLHYVSITISVQEMVSRAAVKVCQVLQDAENHLRIKERRPIRDQIDFLSKHATNPFLILEMKILLRIQ